MCWAWSVNRKDRSSNRKKVSISKFHKKFLKVIRKDKVDQQIVIWRLLIQTLFINWRWKLSLRITFSKSNNYFLSFTILGSYSNFANFSIVIPALQCCWKQSRRVSKRAQWRNRQKRSINYPFSPVSQLQPPK